MSRFRSKKSGIDAREVIAFSKAMISYVKANADAQIAAKDAEIAALRREVDETRRQYQAAAPPVYVVGPLPKHPDINPVAAQWLAEEILRIKTDAEDRRIREGDDE